MLRCVSVGWGLEAMPIGFGFFLLHIALQLVEGIHMVGLAANDRCQFAFHPKFNQKIAGAGQDF